MIVKASRLKQYVRFTQLQFVSIHYFYDQKPRRFFQRAIWCTQV